MKNNQISIFKTFKLSFALIILAVFVQGCGGGSDFLSPVSSEDKILAFGDSLTEGVGVKDSNDSYPSVLSRLIGRTVINAGISGEITKEGLNRLTKVIDDNNPYLMILLEGGNDFLQNVSSEDTKKNLSSMIDIAKGKGVQVVLLGVPDTNLSLSVPPFYQELADEHSLVYDGELIRTLLLKPEYKSDLVHFNEAGYQKMAEEIHQLLIDNGALK